MGSVDKIRGISIKYLKDSCKLGKNCETGGCVYGTVKEQNLSTHWSRAEKERNLHSGKLIQPERFSKKDTESTGVA